MSERTRGPSSPPPTRSGARASRRLPTVEYDPEADAVYVRLSRGAYVHGEDLDDARRIDYGEAGQPIGVELLNVSLGVETTGLPEAATIRRLLTEQGIKVAA